MNMFLNGGNDLIILSDAHLFVLVTVPNVDVFECKYLVSGQCLRLHSL